MIQQTGRHAQVAAAASATAQDSLSALLDQTTHIERLSADITSVLTGIQGLAA